MGVVLCDVGLGVAVGSRDRLAWGGWGYRHLPVFMEVFHVKHLGRLSTEYETAAMEDVSRGTVKSRRRATPEVLEATANREPSARKTR